MTEDAGWPAAMPSPLTGAATDNPAAPVAAPPGAVPPREFPAFDPHPSTKEDGGSVPPETSDLGVLARLVGSWAGEGLNVIWTPSQTSETGSGHFLQLAKTIETQDYVALDGTIPNRGLQERDLFMSGARYTQQISSNGKGVHFEDGIWLNVPETTAPQVPAALVRMACIPHGTTINAQGPVGVSSPAVGIPTASITPFQIGNPASQVTIPEQDLNVSTEFRTPDATALGFDQSTLNDVNTFLRTRVPADAMSVTAIHVSCAGAAPLPGGGIANTAFLGPNATTSSVTQDIWLFTMAGQTEPTLMLYSQTVLLDFAGLSWPHITVGALTRQTAPAGSA